MAILFLASGFFGHVITEEYTAPNNVTFYNADLQVTIGVNCIRNTVMYKVRDSIHQMDFPPQDLNENRFGAELKGRMFCEGTTFSNEEGRHLSGTAVLSARTVNAISGFVKWSERQSHH